MPAPLPVVQCVWVPSDLVVRIRDFVLGWRHPHRSLISPPPGRAQRNVTRAWLARFPCVQTSGVCCYDAIVSQLWRYPVKSFRGEKLEEVSLDSRGVIGDRAFAVRDANGKFGSGKTTRRFRLLRELFDFSAKIDRDAVVVSAPGGGSFRVGDANLDALLSARYGESLAVVPEGAISHFDAGPVHVLTTSSLEWVDTNMRGRAAMRDAIDRTSCSTPATSGSSRRRGWEHLGWRKTPMRNNVRASGVRFGATIIRGSCDTDGGVLR